MSMIMIIIGTVLVIMLLWMALHEPRVNSLAFQLENDPLNFLLENNIDVDSPLEHKLLARFSDQATGIQDALCFQSYIYQRAERGFCGTYQWHYFLWMIRRLDCCSEEEYMLAVKTAQACTLLTEDELLFPPLAFVND